MQVQNAMTNPSLSLPRESLSNIARRDKDEAAAAPPANGPKAHGVVRSVMAAVSNAAVPVPDTSLPTKPQRLDIDELMGAWGTADPRYDLNGDGTVNVQDLLALLAGMSAANEGQPEPAATQIAAEPADGQIAAAPGVQPSPELTVEGLMNAWGTDDPDYDLNGDGTVNVQDLLALLASMDAGSPAAPEPASAQIAREDSDVPGQDPSNEPLTIDGLMAAWGQSGTPYDLNGDGTVNVQDLLALLAKMGGPAEPSADPAAVATAASEVSAPAPTEPPLTIRNLLQAWGTNDARFDINGDGTVNVQDLLMLLARQSGQQPPAEETAVAATRLRPIAQTLMARLEAAGFSAQPPTNIHELVEHLRLPAGHQKLLMEALAARYPAGLGVNVVT